MMAGNGLNFVLKLMRVKFRVSFADSLFYGSFQKFYLNLYHLNVKAFK